MSDRSSSIPTPVVALIAWLCPGAGYLVIGQRSRGLTIGITVLILFLFGLLIGGLKVVAAPDLGGAAGGLRGLVSNDPWFIAQFFTGPVGLLTAYIAKDPAFAVSHARMNEIGTLYTAVAGMLNFLAIIDSTSRAIHRHSENA